MKEVFGEMIDDLVSEPDLNKRIEKGRVFRRRLTQVLITVVPGWNSWTPQQDASKE